MSNLKRLKNRWSVMVVFPGRFAYGIDSNHDKEHTAADVLRELTDLCQRIRRDLKTEREKAAIEVDGQLPQVGS